MDSDKYLEGKSMQRPPLFESDHFIYWKNRFETYVKAKDLDLWHIILNGDFSPLAKNEVTQILEVVSFEEQSDDLKKKLAKNNEAKMVLYNALPKKEYERIFMYKTVKDIWQSLLITHQGNSQVKDNKIDLLVQQYEQFTILEEESIDNGFARFNTIITSLKALDEGFSSKNYVRKLADGTKSYPVGIVKNVEVHIGRLKLSDDFYVINMDKDPATPLLVGRGFLSTANVVIDCKKAKIVVGERVTRSIFAVKEIDLGEEEVPCWTTLGKRVSYTPRPSMDRIGARPPYYAKKDFTDYHFLGD
ncbi:DUF4219 domain-containing protein [Tanacetum coccineum]